PVTHLSQQREKFLYGQSRKVPEPAAQGVQRGKDRGRGKPDRAGAAGVGHRVDTRALAASQGADRALFGKAARPAGERAAEGWRKEPGGSEPISGVRLSAAVAKTVRLRASQQRGRASATGRTPGSGQHVEPCREPPGGQQLHRELGWKAVPNPAEGREAGAPVLVGASRRSS